MKITSDWHIHSTQSCDCGGRNAEPAMAQIVAAARKLGIEKLGITDHVNTPYNLDDIFRSREEFDSMPFDADLHFGVEASAISQWELDEIESGRQPATDWGLRTGGPEGGKLALGITQDDITQYGIEYVVAGTHWAMYVSEQNTDKVMADYHRQNLFLASHPLVDILAHPWWYGGNWWRDEDKKYRGDPWLDDFGKIPFSMHDELAAALVESKTAMEINLDACLFNDNYPETFTREYADFISYMHERGVKFSVGTDSHGEVYRGKGYEGSHLDLDRAAVILEEIGIATEDLWSLPPRAEPEEKSEENDKPLSKYQQKKLRQKEEE